MLPLTDADREEWLDFHPRADLAEPDHSSFGRAAAIVLCASVPLWLLFGWAVGVLS